MTGTIFIEMMNYFNSEPAEDLKYTEQCKNSTYCSKCLFPHDNTHKCNAYGRLFGGRHFGTTGQCKNSTYCAKCLFPHDNTHKCYAYDRIFRETVLLILRGVINDNELLYHDMFGYYCKNKKGRYNIDYEDHGGAGSYLMYMRVGQKWFERHCWQDNYCEEMKQIIRQ
jgi:hypothetical protein